VSLRKVASLIALIALLLVGGKYVFHVFDSGPVPVEIHYLLGDPPVASGLDVQLGQDAHFETTLVSPDVVQKTRLPSGERRAAITMISRSGERHTVYRSIEVQRDAVIKVDLSHEPGGG
jgi:hypothetical protein